MGVSAPTHARGLGLLAAAVVVCAWPGRAADLPNAAKVVMAEGRVSVQRNGELWALFGGNVVHVGEFIITGPDGVAKLEIADGSSFDVYPNSRVVFRANPGNMRDLVEVLLGRIRVYIQTFGGRPNPYRVHSPTAVISVRGTIFDVGVENDAVTTVAVTEGHVSVQHRLLPSNKDVELAPGESLRIFPNAALVAAGVSKLAVVSKIAEAVRDTLYGMPRSGSGQPSGGTPPKGPSGPPADTGAPPPPPPADQQAPPPPPGR